MKTHQVTISELAAKSPGWIELKSRGTTVTYMPSQRMPGRLEVRPATAGTYSGKEVAPYVSGAGTQTKLRRLANADESQVLEPGATFRWETSHESYFIRLLPGDGFGVAPPADVAGPFTVWDLETLASSASNNPRTYGDARIDPGQAVSIRIGNHAAVPGLGLRAPRAVRIPAMYSTAGTLVGVTTLNRNSSINIVNPGELFTQYELANMGRAVLAVSIRNNQNAGTQARGTDQSFPYVSFNDTLHCMTAASSQEEVRFYIGAHINTSLARADIACGMAAMWGNSPPSTGGATARNAGTIVTPNNGSGNLTWTVQCEWVFEDCPAPALWEVLQASLDVTDAGLGVLGVTYVGAALPCGVCNRRVRFVSPSSTVAGFTIWQHTADKIASIGLVNAVIASQVVVAANYRQGVTFEGTAERSVCWTLEVGATTNLYGGMHASVVP